MIPLSSPIIWNSLHFVSISLKISISFFISFTKSLFIDNNTTHILQHTIIHYPSFSHFIILKYHHLAAHKHIPIFFSIFSCNTSLLRMQHNPWHNTKNHSNSSYNLIYLLYFTFISSILHFHTYYKYHISQYIYIYIYIYISYNFYTS